MTTETASIASVTAATDAEIEAMVRMFDEDYQIQSLIARIHSEREQAVRECAEIGWQDIETAPNDVVGYFASPVAIGFVEWGEGDKHRTHVGPIIYYECYGNWEFMELDCDMFPHPTHWQPLPTPPLIDRSAKT